MKNLRLATLAILLVLLVSVSACTASVPVAVMSLSGLLHSSSATSGATATAATSAPVAAAAAPSTVVYSSDLQQALQQAYEAANPSVVNIQVKVQSSGSLQEMLPGLPFDFNAPDQSNPETPQVPQYTQGLGSGFVWDKQGHIVTNNHVVDGAEEINVTFSDGTSLPAQLVGHDPDSDLAVIKVDPGKVDLRPIEVGDSGNVKVGQFVIAIGNPYGLEGTMTFGIVSAIGRTISASGEAITTGPSYTIPDIIQTDAPVNPGNSGGVLLDLEGRLIGVPSQIESPVRANAGIGFAIPATTVQKVVPVLIEKGAFEHPWIGISGTTLTPQLAKQMGLPESQRGAIVMDVTKNSPAEQAGLQGSTKEVQIDGQNVKVGGDVIVAVEGQPVKDFEDLVTWLGREGEVGKKIQLTVIRDGNETAVSLTLAARPTQTSEQKPEAQAPQAPAPQAPTEKPQATGGNTWLGIKGVTLNEELATAMNLNAGQKGALIQNVVSGSPADKAGLRGGYKTLTVGGQEILVGGDVITKADSKAVESMDQLAQIVQGAKAGDKLTLTVLRDGESSEIEVTLAARPASAQ